MRWVPDTTGRFRWRPYFRASEIDALCERRVRSFLRTRYGAVAYPLTTDDLTVLIEQEADDLDLFADLECVGTAGREVQGMTAFARGERPRVQVSRVLSLDPRREARLRTTLAHELGHVLLHNFIGDGDSDVKPPLPDDGDTDVAIQCPPETVRGVQRADWMEWQAAYASGALLMPRMAVALTVLPVLRRSRRGRPLPGSTTGRLIDVVQGQFLVSAAAALVRLRQLGYTHGRAPHAPPDR